ncbi:hypothetical protein BSL78_24535 [Apostichopus japonicus]|uniref:Uncharacterized protein n=1 Tax=Stichopus japonicus TaxID=307972 RepID=A0A2G8JSF8_STIJA|nr:hypothetical protein BSL78_24535 [Apostichopus japonicus]
MKLCASRENFAEQVLSSFESVGAHIIQWVSCQETHRDGGKHYHMAVKLDRPRRWLKVKSMLENQHGIVVHFSSTYANYYTAWQYVVKEDAGVLQSPGHPDLGASPPATTSASTSRVLQASGEQSARAPLQKRKRLSAFDVSQMVAWELHDAESKLERGKKSRPEILDSFKGQPCVPGCNGLWSTIAEDILRRNNIPAGTFQRVHFNELLSTSSRKAGVNTGTFL